MHLPPDDSHGNGGMNTLNLQQAAALLKIHPVTLQEKARAGEIPGAPGQF